MTILSLRMISRCKRRCQGRQGLDFVRIVAEVKVLRVWVHQIIIVVVVQVLPKSNRTLILTMEVGARRDATLEELPIIHLTHGAIWKIRIIWRKEKAVQRRPKRLIIRSSERVATSYQTGRKHRLLTLIVSSQESIMMSPMIEKVNRCLSQTHLAHSLMKTIALLMLLQCHKCRQTRRCVLSA